MLPVGSRCEWRACYPSTTMSDPALKPVYLIIGSDRPKVRRAIQRLRRRVIAESGSDINVAAFEVESGNTAAALQALLEAADTPGFALGTRLLLVLNAHHFKVKERKEILAYIHDPMPGTTLALEAEKWAKDDALYKTVLKAGDVLTFDLPKRYEMAGWVRERAAARKLPMSAAVARHLLDVCGEEPGHSERLEREIEKLALYCRGAEAAPVDVDAVGHRDRTRAFGLLETIFASGDPQDDANRVLYSLLRHVRKLEEAWQLGASDQSTAAKQLGVHPFTAKKLLEQRKNYDRRRFDRAYRALAVAEPGMRGRAPATLETAAGVNHSDRLVVELALARLLS